MLCLRLFNKIIFILAGSDFDMVDFSSQFNEGATSGTKVCVNVTILDDDAYEKDENLTIHLSSEYNVNINNPYSVVEIQSNDGTTL